MKRIKNLFSLVILVTLMFSVSDLEAQIPQQGQGQQQDIEVSDSELKTFAKIMQAIQEYQKDAQMVIMEAVQKNPDITIKQYQKISQARQRGQKLDLSEKEKAAFNEIQQVTKEEQKRMDEKINSIFKEHEMGQKRYMQINKALQTDKELQKRLQQFMTPQQPQQ